LNLSARGQDALFNSASLDQTTAARTAQFSTQPYVGPVQFGLGANAGVTYDDNVNSSQVNPESDVLTQTGINVSLNWPATDASDLQFGTSIGYVNYERQVSNSGLEISPDSALTYAISFYDVAVTFFDQLSYTRQVHTEAALANITTLPQLNNNIGLQSEWDPGHWVLSASYSHDNTVSEHADDYLNHSAEDFVGRLGWRFAEATQAGMEASDTLTAYQVSSLYNSANLSVGGYLDWQVQPSLTVTLGGGPVFYMPEFAGPAGANGSQDTYYVNASISHQLTDYLSHSLSVNRSLQAGLNQGGSYIEQLTAAYAIHWQLTQRIGVSVSANYVDGQQPFATSGGASGVFLASTVENYDQYGGGFQISWKITDHLSTTLNYNHLERTSNLSGRDYSDDQIGLQLNYTF